MKIGYYCPLIGNLFFKSLGIVPIDLRTIDYEVGDVTYCQSGSNKCSFICRMSGLIQKSYSLDGIILTNCCHEQEQLFDFLSKGDKLKIFKINIPRNRSLSAVKFLADQLEVLARQFGGYSTKLVGLEQMSNSAFNSCDQSTIEFLPVVIFGISIPFWLTDVLKKNNLLAVIEERCGFLPGVEKHFLAGVDLSLAFAETIVYHGSCIRNTSQTERNSLLELKLTDRSPLAVLFISLEYCTASTYGFVRVKDYFESKKIPVFKIDIPEWSKPSVKVITQIESVAHICKEIKR